MKLSQILIVMSSLTMLAGCGNWRHTPTIAGTGEYQTVAADPTRNTSLAREHNASAVMALNEGDIDTAERRLKEALSCDVFYGPAHNNLGHIYFQQKKYYLAAWEFQYAAKLMPNHAEPKNNLALVLEAAGKANDAAKYYEQALKIQPDNPELIGNLARVYVKQHQNTPKTRELLHDIIMKDTRPEWTRWASEQLSSKSFSDEKN